MKLLESKKLTLPKVYFVWDRNEIKKIPPGVPFLYGDVNIEKNLIRMLEYEVLWNAAIASGYPFDFKKILKDNGYLDLKYFDYGSSVYMEFTSEGISEEFKELTPLMEQSELFSEFIRDSAVYVDIAKLKELNVFPIWLDTIEKSIETNIHNFAVFNNNIYNKKLEGMYGGLELNSPSKNLIIIDISGSIPRGVSSTCLTLSKNLADSFYADLLITGSISILYQYEEIYKLDIETIYEMGQNNDQIHFEKLLKEHRKYKTCICFGDNDSPGYNWNGKGRTISDREGKEICKWEVDKLISFHTKGIDSLAAYGRWFSPLEVERVKNWVKYL